MKNQQKQSIKPKETTRSSDRCGSASDVEGGEESGEDEIEILDSSDESNDSSDENDCSQMADNHFDQPSTTSIPRPIIHDKPAPLKRLSTKRIIASDDEDENDTKMTEDINPNIVKPKSPSHQRDAVVSSPVNITKIKAIWTCNRCSYENHLRDSPEFCAMCE